ncbi:uncharacterized protein LOC116424883 [Nomia melanderi]|uniref:uncharacterized protein LOC116424883 n=1 Tax=Nomia melanderi TaxID=2448451 RepID=UPI003FCE9033
MRILRMVFSTLIMCGCWQPDSWTSPMKLFLYHAYTMIVFSLVYSVTFYQFMEILLNVKSLDELADNLYMFIEMAFSCQKMLNLLRSRENIAGLMSIFEEEPFVPRNTEELEIRSRFDKKTQSNTILYLSLLMGTCFSLTFSVFLKPEKWPLIFNIWLPYNYSSISLYSSTLAQQSLALHYGALAHAACDSLICGLLIHTSSQLEILRSRLRAIKRGENRPMKLCVRFHDRVYRFAQALNNEFKMIIFVQFMVSVSVVCFNLYRLSKSGDQGSKLLEVIPFSSCILSQIFLYCWYGNEVKLKSLEISDTVLDMNWTILDDSQKKMLMMIMRRALVPVEFTSIHVASLNLASFMGVSIRGTLIKSQEYKASINRARTNVHCRKEKVLEQKFIERTMPTLQWTSTVLSALGCQRPSTWTSPPRKFWYKVYGFATLLMVQTVAASAILDIAFNVRNQDDFSDNLYLSMPMVISCCKMCAFLANRESITSLLNSLQEKPYSPAGTVEMSIDAKYDRINERITVGYTILTEFSVAISLIAAIIENPKNRALTFRAWVPYDYSSLPLYTVTFLYQATGVTLGSLMNVAYDSLFSGMMFCIYSQLEIVGHRLRKVTGDDEQSVKQCARHLDYIYQFAAKINEDFQIVLCIQFVASMFIICFTLYRIAQMDFDSRLLEMVVYAICMLLQILYYCWYGNEVKLKSLEITDVIFASNWTNLDNATKKTLLIIMLRATFPIEFTTAHIMSVNIDSFMVVLKTSYSAYNVLQQGTMPSLQWTTTMLSMLGCRRPPTWTSPSKKLSYKVYGFVTLFLTQTLTASAILDVAFNVKNQEEFGDNLYLTIPMAISCCKMCSFLANRESITSLLNSLQEKPYLPANTAETTIETRYDRINERISTLYTVTIELCISLMIVSSMIVNTKDRVLTFRAWLPYDYSSPILYAVTFAHQAVSVTIGSLMNVAYDTLFSGLMFSIYSQLEILGHRLQNITRNHRESAKLCARHHNYIYELAGRVNGDFQMVLCVQFASSMTIICFTLYRITQTDLGSRLVETCMYAVCMLMQIFYYSWYGNEVRLKSLQISDSIFASNWSSLDDGTKKILLMIMLRATFPIEFTTARVLTVNLESFVSVLKTSYSAYNVLQRG